MGLRVPMGILVVKFLKSIIYYKIHFLYYLKKVGRVTPSPFAATLRQKIKIEKKKFNGRTFAPVFHPSTAMFSSCPCVFALRSVCRKGGKRGNGWEEGRKRGIRDGRRKGGRYVTSTVTSLNNEFMKT